MDASCGQQPALPIHNYRPAVVTNVPALLWRAARASLCAAFCRTASDFAVRNAATNSTRSRIGLAASTLAPGASGARLSIFSAAPGPPDPHV